MDEDPLAMTLLAGEYRKGGLGLPVDNNKAFELCLRSSELGCGEASFMIGNSYFFGEMGRFQDKKKALSYYKLAAERGHARSWYNLGINELHLGNKDRAISYWRVAAAMGHLFAFGNLIAAFAENKLCHADLAGSMQAKDKIRLEMRSEGRDVYVEHLKITGEFEEEYEDLM